MERVPTVHITARLPADTWWRLMQIAKASGLTMPSMLARGSSTQASKLSEIYPQSKYLSVEKEMRHLIKRSNKGWSDEMVEDAVETIRERIKRE